MLVLTRRRGEVIVIERHGVPLKVLIADINRGQVKVGIEAPREVSIVREELLSSGQKSDE